MNTATPGFLGMSHAIQSLFYPTAHDFDGQQGGSAAIRAHLKKGWLLDVQQIHSPQLAGKGVNLFRLGKGHISNTQQGAAGLRVNSVFAKRPMSEQLPWDFKGHIQHKFNLPGTCQTTDKSFTPPSRLPGNIAHHCLTPVADA